MSRPTNLSVKERVANGAAWLDEEAPGWPHNLDLENLDIADRDRPCVLTQLGEALADARMSPDWDLVDHGFYWVGFLPENGGRARLDCDRLNAEWTRVVRERLA